MRHYCYMDQNFFLPRRSFIWFFKVRSGRLLRQYQRNDPARLAVFYAEAHLR